LSRKEKSEAPDRPVHRPGTGALVHLVGAVVGAILLVLSVPFFLLAGWGLLFNVPTLAVVAFTAAWVLFPLFNRIKAVRVLKLGVSFVIIPATLALAPLMVQEVDAKVEQLRQKPRSDASSFTLPDRVGIYGLNVVMSTAGYPLYPEASRETFLMMFNPGPFGRRVFASEFGLGSRKIRASLQSIVQRLQFGDTAASFGPVRVEWSKNDYRLTEPEARYALALNQTRLTANAVRRGERWLLDVRHEMEVKYPESVYVTLIGRPRLRVEEGLFWVLQNCGWLHPYVAEYRFLVYSDDPRLR
jgi:hypothetical protein